MGYKLLGLIVWKGGRWYVRRRFAGLGRKLALAGVGGLLLGGGAAAFAASRRAQGE